MVESRQLAVKKLVAKRLVLLPVLLVIISLGIFALAAVSPLDPLVGYLQERYQFVSETQREVLAQALNLDQPWWQAWGQWWQGVFSGDLGYSRTYRVAVSQVLMQRLPATLILSATSLVVAFLMAIVLGLAATRFPRLGKVIRSLTVVIQATPPFAVALGAVLVLALQWGWFPAGGRAATASSDYLDLNHLIAPTFVLALTQLPWLLLTLLDATQTALRSEFTWRSQQRGIPSWRILTRQIIPLSLAPTVTMLGMRLPELIVGAVLVEEVFSWGGIAQALVDAARTLDLPLLAILTLGSAALVILGSLLADICYLFLDPRVRFDD